MVVKPDLPDRVADLPPGMPAGRVIRMPREATAAAASPGK